MQENILVHSRILQLQKKVKTSVGTRLIASTLYRLLTPTH